MWHIGGTPGREAEEVPLYGEAEEAAGYMSRPANP